LISSGIREEIFHFSFPTLHRARASRQPDKNNLRTNPAIERDKTLKNCPPVQENIFSLSSKPIFNSQLHIPAALICWFIFLTHFFIWLT